MNPALPSEGEPALPLVVQRQPNAPARPKQTDQRVIAAAANTLAPRLVQWSNGDVTLEEAKSDLHSALLRSSDGYTIARHLEDEGGYSPDAGLVEEMDAAFSHLHSALTALVEEWVNINGIQPEFQVGDEVKHARYGLCVICRVDEKCAQYVIQNDDWRAKHSGQSSTGGMVVDFERVTAVAVEK